jgi:hypothetical protein
MFSSAGIAPPRVVVGILDEYVSRSARVGVMLHGLDEEVGTDDVTEHLGVQLGPGTDDADVRRCVP